MKMSPDDVYLIEEMQGFMTGAGTISFNEFTYVRNMQNLMRINKLDRVIAAQGTYVQPQEEKLKEIILLEPPPVEASGQQVRRVKSKKKK
jgi:hypothetical protein